MTENSLISQIPQDLSQFGVLTNGKVYPMAISMKASVMKNFFELVGSVISENAIVVSSKGIEGKGMDLSHICLTYATIFPSSCISYQCQNTYQLGLNLEDVNKILKKIKISKKNDPIITMCHNPKEKKILFYVNKSKITITLIDCEIEEIDLQSLESMEYDTSFTANTKELLDAIESNDIFSEVSSFKFDTDEKKLILSSIGNVGDIESEIDLTELNLKSNIDSHDIYANSFLKSILKVIKTENITLYIKSESPIKIITEIGENLDKDGISFPNISKTIYYIAPRVEEESNDDE